MYSIVKLCKAVYFINRRFLSKTIWSETFGFCFTFLSPLHLSAGFRPVEVDYLAFHPAQELLKKAFVPSNVSEIHYVLNSVA